MTATTVRRKRRRKPPARLGPYAAGSPEAVRIVRGFVTQQERVRGSGSEVDAMLRRLQRPGRRRFV